MTAQTPQPDGQDQVITFRPADIGMPAMEVYEFPHMGMNVVLSDTLQSKLSSQEAVLLTDAGYTGTNQVRYALLSFHTLTPEQNQPVTAFDPTAWKASLGKIGVLGVYSTEAAADLDNLTGCTNHLELGKSDDGSYVYYLSLPVDGDEALKKELENTQVVLTEMVPVDLSRGNDAFSQARVDTNSLGSFTTTDIQGEEVTQDIFKDYDLTLVNLFATWCSPCVNEMPELQKLKDTMADRGVNVVAVVLDGASSSGQLDQNALEMARLLQERLNLTFPLLIPEETGLNGRLYGVNSVPESFFVDREGNIVGETYVGARSYDEWKAIVEQELQSLPGTAQ